MGKKITANPKAVDAKAKKEEKKINENNVKQKAKEDAMWVDDDKNGNKKNQRKEDKESKRIQQLDKKKELQNLAEKEMNEIAPKKAAPIKMSQYQVEQLKQKSANVKPKVFDEPIPQNTNRLQVEGEEARSLDAALKLMGVEDKPERHAEKRVKAAYLAFEERRLPELKIENPGLRLSQLKQLLSKEFEKSSENPKNQAHLSYNFKPQNEVSELPDSN